MSKRFVSIWLPYLATDWHARKQPSLKEKVFVLKATVRNRVVVTAANKLARAQGIHKEMVLADAKALYPSLHVLDDKPNLTTQLLDRMAEWCIRFTPIAAADYPDGVMLDASGCTHLWGGEEAYLKDITNRLTSRGYTVRAAMADTIACAWAMARYGKETIVEKGGQVEALASLPVSSLRLEEEKVVLLNKLGLRQVKNVFNLPHKSLRRRFGAALLQRLQQAIGEEEENIIPVYPIEPFQERLPCIEPIRTKEGIEIALQHLLSNLCFRLRNEGKGLRRAFFRAYRLDGGTSGMEIATNQASQNREHLFQLFSIKLSTIEPKEGIELFLLEATVVEEATVKQEGLWQMKSGALDADVLGLMDRFTARFGQNAVQRFLPTEHYWPERSFKKSTDLNEEPTTEWKLDRPRPMQIVSPPELIEVTAPIPDYPPLNFRYKGQLHKIVKADGPERIEQEWWIQEGEHRDYYAVEDEEGRRYWLFRLGHYNEAKSPKWFLHGFFA
ncbi:MAG: DNA polymerase Y family protein [Chitinophagaceae bacterium]|nr:MAG: DNA polymerase Y family protein [Chitinophagaceae bacterium]